MVLSADKSTLVKQSPAASGFGGGWTDFSAPGLYDNDEAHKYKLGSIICAFMFFDLTDVPALLCHHDQVVLFI